jgi:hypothetical protein
MTDIRASLNGACERAGVPHIHIHGLRHAFGSQTAMAGTDPFAIMKAMGHTDIKTTMIYVSLAKRPHRHDEITAGPKLDPWADFTKKGNLARGQIPFEYCDGAPQVVLCGVPQGAHFLREWGAEGGI